MNLPVASAPVAVLVLAWDETTPAARVLVDAPAAALESAHDSVVALVPTGPAANERRQEEFLPFEASIAPPEPPATSAPLPIEVPTAAAPAADDAPAAIATTEATAAAPLLAGVADPADAPPEPVVVAAQKAALRRATSEPVATEAALVRPALVWQEVRVLRFGLGLGTGKMAADSSYLGQGEPTFVWTGGTSAPAAPYLGSSEPTSLGSLTLASLPGEVGHLAVAAALLAATDTAATALAALRALSPVGSRATVLTSQLPATTPPPTYWPEELPEAPDAESDATPAPLADEPVPTSAASGTELSEETTAAENSFAVDSAPVQATEPAAPAPAPAAEPAFFAPAESPPLAALRPTGQPFDAPDLNFQIIQYARMAVPQAVQQSFEVIYAPAWPTWLAAQELRHRSGQPLVLHIAKLAAADDELIDLAAGWIAELQRQALHRADLILTETPALAQRLRHELALPTHRVRAVPAADAVAVAQALRTAQRG